MYNGLGHCLTGDLSTADRLRQLSAHVIKSSAQARREAFCTNTRVPLEREENNTLKYHTLEYDYSKYYYLTDSTKCMADLVNRTEELARLRELYRRSRPSASGLDPEAVHNSADAELAVIYGRHRLG